MDKMKRDTFTEIKHQKILDAWDRKLSEPRPPKNAGYKRIREEIAEEFDCSPGHVYLVIWRNMQKQKEKQ